MTLGDPEVTEPKVLGRQGPNQPDPLSPASGLPVTPPTCLPVTGITCSPAQPSGPTRALGPQGSCPAAPLVTSSLSSQTLKEWVAIQSDSVQPLPHLRRELFRMMTVAADALRGLGASVDLVDAGSQQVPGSSSL